MKKILLICIIIPILCACEPQSSKNIRPNATSNNAAVANLNLGIEYMRRGEYEKALDRLTKATSADPRYYATYNVLGLLYQQLGDMTNAEKNFKKALSLNDQDSRTMNNYGLFLCRNHRIDEAEAIFNRATENPLYNTPEIAITNAGTCMVMNNQPDKAMDYFRKALSANPRIPSALIQMSQLTFDNGNHLSARAYLQRYLAIAAHTANSLWLGIQIENKMGDKNAVSSYSLQLRNNFPDSKETILLKQFLF